MSDFTCELYQPGRETAALAAGDDTRHGVEASGFTLEQIIGVHGYPYLSSSPCALIGEVKVGVCGVTWFSRASPAAPELLGNAGSKLSLCPIGMCPLLRE